MGTQTFQCRTVRQLASSPDLTVVIPAYNEERRLPATLATLKEELDHWFLDYRVIVVDDGSRDATFRVVEAFDARFSCCRLPVNSGKGAAVRAGMLMATGEVVAFTDADLPFALDALREGYFRILERRCDVVCGDRRAGSRRGRSAPWARRLSGFVFRQLVQWLVSPCVADTQCGLKIFSRTAAQEIFRCVQAPGFAFDVDVVCQAERLGYSIETVPVQLVNTDGSTISLRRHAWPIFKELLAVRRRLVSAANDAAATMPTPMPSCRTA